MVGNSSEQPPLPRRRVRVFWFAKGKLRRIYDESLEAAEELQRGDAGAYRLEAIDFGRRVSIEKDIQGNEDAPAPNAVFDESGNFIIYPTLLGIKVRSDLLIVSCCIGVCNAIQSHESALAQIYSTIVQYGTVIDIQSLIQLSCGLCP